MALTIRQERFCQEYVTNHGNATNAYKAAYSTANMKPETINNKGYVQLQKDEIRKRVRELKEQLTIKYEYTINDAMAEFNEAIQMAKEDRIVNAMVSAVKAKVELFGLDAPKQIKTTNLNVEVSRELKSLSKETTTAIAEAMLAELADK